MPSWLSSLICNYLLNKVLIISILPVVQDEGSEKKRNEVFVLQEITVQPGRRHEHWRNKGLPRVWDPELLLTEWLNWLLLTPVQGGRDTFPFKLSSFQRARKEGRDLSKKESRGTDWGSYNQGPPRE